MATILSRLRGSRLLKDAIFAGVIFGASEITQEVIQGEKINLPHIGRIALTGLLFYGPFCHGFYRVLDTVLPGIAKKTIIKKLVLDQSIAGPISVSGFYVVMSILERKSDIFAEAKDKTLHSLGACVMFWVPAQWINFRFVSPQFRVTYITVMTYAWANFLCFMKNWRAEKVLHQQHAQCKNG
ncbi:mpv17-like protein [Glandiceps talaboti]